MDELWTGTGIAGIQDTRSTPVPGNESLPVGRPKKPRKEYVPPWTIVVTKELDARIHREIAHWDGKISDYVRQCVERCLTEAENRRRAHDPQQH